MLRPVHALQKAFHLRPFNNAEGVNVSGSDSGRRPVLSPSDGGTTSADIGASTDQSGLFTGAPMATVPSGGADGG